MESLTRLVASLGTLRLLISAFKVVAVTSSSIIMVFYVYGVGAGEDDVCRPQF